MVGITSEEEDASEMFSGNRMPKNGSLFMCDGASWSTVVEEGELVDAAGLMVLFFTGVLKTAGSEATRWSAHQNLPMNCLIDSVPRVYSGVVDYRRKLGVKPNKSKLSSSDAALKLVACQVAINSPKVKAVLYGKDDVQGMSLIGQEYLIIAMGSSHNNTA
ncbi:hypothetical protein Tco_0503546 [Tanacetum coccineum]